MDGFIRALNINGNQNIARLQMAIDQTTAPNGHHKAGRMDPPTQSMDLRAPSRERDVTESGNHDDSNITTFDMDFFPAESGERNGRERTSGKKTYVFGQAENYRVEEVTDSKGTNDVNEGYERTRRRAAGLPLIQKLVCFPFFLAIL